MADYVVKGELHTTVTGISYADLKVVAYKPLTSTSIKLLGSCKVDASGKFHLAFEGPTIGGGPMDIFIMPIPGVIEQYLLNIEMSVPGLLFPRVRVLPGDWTMTGGAYTKTVSITIPADIWGRWRWLSEEFTVIGRLVKRVGDVLLPVPHAWVSAADVDVPMPQAWLPGRPRMFTRETVGNVKTDSGGNFTVTFPRVSFWINFGKPHIGVHIVGGPPYGTEDWPNLIFNATQMIAGTKVEIYKEGGDVAREKSLWDVPHRILYVELVTELGVVFDETYLPILAGDNFRFHGIGHVQAHSLSNGYATTGSTDDLPNLKDCPFGSTLYINGQFDTKSGPNSPRYYQLLYARWTKSTEPVLDDFHPILDERWTVSRYDPATGNADPVVVEPLSDKVVNEKVYQIPDYTDMNLTEKTRLIRWTTDRQDLDVDRYPDGKYDLLVKAWDSSKNPVDVNAAHPESARLTVVLDNTMPKALLRKIGPFEIKRTDEMQPYTPECPVFSKSDTALGGHVAVSFDATDENNHFESYVLSFITGHNLCIDQVSKVYDGNPGGFLNEIYDWTIGSSKVVKCAYQVRLRVRDRAINGYGHIHEVEDTMHFSIEP